MYKPTEPIRCPKCGAIVKVDLYKILTSNPPCYEWTCPNCGKKGNTKHGDVITFENQVIPATSGYIQKVGEYDLSTGFITTNATEDSTANAMPTPKSTITDPKSTACNIPAPQFIRQGWQCPKCGAILAPNQSYCPFCSRKESDWITTVGTGTQPFYANWTNKDNLTPPSGQYINPNPSISISDLSVTYATPADNITVKA